MSLKNLPETTKNSTIKKILENQSTEIFYSYSLIEKKLKGNSNFMIIYSLHVLRKTVQGSDCGLWWVYASKYITLTIGHWPTVRNDDEI